MFKMALKDWKKVGNKLDGDISFYNKKTLKSIHMTDDSLIGGDEWDLVILSTKYYTKNTKTLHRKTYTYSQALAYAKAYMRKH